MYQLGTYVPTSIVKKKKTFTMLVGVQQIYQSVTQTTVFYPLLTLCTILFFLHLWIQSRPYVKFGNGLPGPSPLPFVGNLIQILYALRSSPTEIMSYTLDIYKRFSNDCVARLWVGNRLVVGLTHPDDIELILNSNVHLEKSEEYSVFEPWLGEGLLISKGEKWRSHRKIIAPTFHTSILKSFVPLFHRNSIRCVKKLRKHLNKEFDVHDNMSEITVDILLETAMGLKRIETEDEESGYDYAMAVMKMCGILHTRHYNLFYYPNLFFNLTNLATLQEKLLGVINNLTRKTISRKKEDYFQRVRTGESSLYGDVLKQEQIKQAESSVTNPKETITRIDNGSATKDDLDENDENDVGEKRRLAFLDFMIEASQTKGMNLSDEEIKEEVNTIMFEGHDTTAAGSSFFLCLLGIHQHIQEKVMEELREIFQDSNRPCTFADTLQMKYLERVLLETLRLYPPVPIIARKMNENVKLVSGEYTIPAGATVVIGTYAVHRRPELYPNPEVFDPDRFLPENCQNRHYYSYIPFSAGPRSCVGRKYAMLKLKVLLSTILRNFKVTSPCTEKEFKLQGDIILKRSDGFRIKMEERRFM